MVAYIDEILKIRSKYFELLWACGFSDVMTFIFRLKRMYLKKKQIYKIKRSLGHAVNNVELAIIVIFQKAIFVHQFFHLDIIF